jgi:hypothetical protein
MKAYTYSIKHKPTNSIYYGVRKSSKEDIGITYFSSSKLVKRLIKTNPMVDFEFKVRRRFDSYEEALLHECRVLRRLNAVTNDMMLNQAISSPRVCSKDSDSENIRKKSISETMKKLWNNPDYRNKQNFNKMSHEERVKRGRSGAKKRAENYLSGKTKKKDKKKPIYNDIEIHKNGVKKIIKANQFPAYSKHNWIKE